MELEVSQTDTEERSAATPQVKFPSLETTSEHPWRMEKACTQCFTPLGIL